MVVGLMVLVVVGVAFLMFGMGKSWLGGVVHKAERQAAVGRQVLCVLHLELACWCSRDLLGCVQV